MSGVPTVTNTGEKLLDKEKIDELNIWYEEGGSFQVWNDLKYVEMNEGALKSYLRTLKVCSKSQGNGSQMDHILTDIRMRKNVIYVGPLAGKQAGIHEANGNRVLVLGGPKLVTADAEADWTLLREIIEGILAPGGGVQVPYFYSWLKVALAAVEKGEYAPGQALALAGPVDSGKSLLQDVIAELLGGRIADPYAYMFGKTTFNRDLFGSETLAFGDEMGSTDIRVRRTMGAKIKQFAVNQNQWCHGKGRQAFTLQPQWRLTLSLNDETENLMVLPPIDEGIEDKLMILRVLRSRIFDDQTRWSNSRKIDWDKIKSVLPGFVAFLHAFEIPQDLRSGRFGVKHYQDPDILVSLNSISPEARLLDLIDMSDLFMDETTTRLPDGQVVKNTKYLWQGSAIELEQYLLRDSDVKSLRDSVSRLLSFNFAVGTYLGRLEKKKNRVERRTVNGQTVWMVSCKHTGADKPTRKKWVKYDQANSPYQKKPEAAPAAG